MRRALLSTLAAASFALAAPVYAHHGVDYDCMHFQFQEDAQAHMRAHPGDPDGLDGEGDGLACERLPRRGVAEVVVPLAAPGARVETRDDDGPSDWSSAGWVVAFVVTAVASADRYLRRRTP